MNEHRRVARGPRSEVHRSDERSREEPGIERDDFGVSDPAVRRVLRTYLDGGRLRTMPRRGAKRRIVLDYLATLFEPGVRYPESEVNAVLRAYYDDVAALRRYLVDEGLLSRATGVYWRTGGWVDVQP
jgi:hypothetical protein